MARKPNYSYEKYQKDLAKKKKQEEKKQRKLEKKEAKLAGDGEVVTAEETETAEESDE